MKLLEGMSYRQWQKRNTEHFNSLSQEKQKKAKKEGYYNVGWEKVKQSWNILQSFKVVSLFEHELNRGNVIEAIDYAVFEAETGKQIAQEGRQELDKIYQDLKKIANTALVNFPLL